MPGDPLRLTPSLAWFIRRHLRSVEDLEVLLILWREPAREWTAVEMAQQVRTNNSVAADCLQWLSAALCDTTGGAEPAYCLGSRAAEHRPALESLEALYRSNRLQLLRVIAPQAPALQDFVDAFRLRGEKEDE